MSISLESNRFILTFNGLTFSNYIFVVSNSNNESYLSLLLLLEFFKIVYY
jgi:hypothetical protein